MILKLPFPILKKYTYEKPIEVTFKIATLEIATKEILKCDLDEVSKFPPEQVDVAVLYAAYITACKDKYCRPIYNEIDAAFWNQKMSKESGKLFHEGVQELIGSLRKLKENTNTEEEKKK